MMRRSAAVALGLALALHTAAAGDGVRDLTADNFDDVIDGSHHALVEFFAPWCGHCKALAPEYERLGATYSVSDDVIIAKVDADAHRDLAGRFEVRGYPTIKWFPKGSTKPEDYSGGRSAEDFVQFINDRTGTRKKLQSEPSDVVVLTPDNFDGIALDAKKDVLVEFYAPWCGHCKSLKPKYEKVATAFRDEDSIVVAKVDADKHRDLGSRFGVSGFPTIKFFPRGDNKEAQDYNGGREEQNFVDFLNEKGGVARNADGSLKADAGRVAALDALVGGAITEDTVQQLKAAAADLTGREAEFADLYIKAAEKVVAKGAAYVAAEKARLSKMLGGSIKPAARTNFQLRRNILAAFSE